MASGSNHTTGGLDKLLHHKHHDEHQDGENGAHSGDHHGEASGSTHPKKESKIKDFEDALKREETKIKRYLERDEELKEEDRAYGGLL
ncbi:DNA primase large subunit Spp2 [Talaromyces marneffei ATCC 18224]|uniref:uncharacterized protein n=1 Tax=Talaromyces marneffei TaxID=37727 RepID=UPI0012A7897E|nr:uncharacterized protein EYB26_004372 [Talaromyces marneffei]KAE8553165.1 hypothetical protein EYB25_004546 [Talaromyces marneffei]QGA16704.1 hypothetical protein EYB26_004372 [Talaromyces marneffei]